jgi:hypothetical protein
VKSQRFLEQLRRILKVPALQIHRAKIGQGLKMPGVGRQDFPVDELGVAQLGCLMASQATRKEFG